MPKSYEVEMENTLNFQKVF